MNAYQAGEFSESQLPCQKMRCLINAKDVRKGLFDATGAHSAKEPGINDERDKLKIK